MNTSTAQLAHVATGAASVVALKEASGTPWWAQILFQLGLLGIQAILAKLNSETDPKGNQLVQVNPNKFVSSPAAGPIPLNHE